MLNDLPPAVKTCFLRVNHVLLCSPEDNMESLLPHPQVTFSSETRKRGTVVDKHVTLNLNIRERTWGYYFSRR